MPHSGKFNLSPGIIEQDNSSLRETKEDIRIEQLIPPEILENKTKLQELLNAYYAFMNMDEFIYQQTLDFNETVVENKATFRINDPDNENDQFFADFDGASSTLVLTDPSGNNTNISLSAVNVAVTNGNELPGTLATSTAAVGKTFTVSGLSAYNGFTAKLTTIVKYWVGPGPSRVMNTIEEAMDIDENAENYLELMQKEIAASLPRNVTVNKRTLYKQIIDFYKLRGSADSIEIFFRLLFNDTVEVDFPFDEVLIPSSGNWDQPAAVTAVVNGAVNNSTSVTLDAADVGIKLGSVFIGGTVTRTDNVTVASINGATITLDTAVTLADDASVIFEPRGIYTDNKGFLSYNIKIQDSKRFQKFAYLIKTGKNLDDWKFAYNKLVHPAGFIYFAEILIFIQLVADVLGVDKTFTRMPDIQPGVIGVEDIPLLVEMFASTFLPTVTARIGKNATVSLGLKTGIINAITVTNGGSGYTSLPTITVTDSGAASGFTTPSLTPVIANGSLQSVTISNGGKNIDVPGLAFSAPTDITFNGSSASIVNVTNDTIQLTSAQQAAFPVGAQLQYTTTGTAIGGLVSGTSYFVVFSNSNLIKLSATSGGSVINLTGVGVGTTHKFTGVTAAATATTLDGALETVTLVEEGFGYTGSSVSISFSGDAISGQSKVNPVATIGVTAEGKLDVDNITISSEGSGFANIFGTIPVPASGLGVIVDVVATHRANKRYTVAPTIVFPEPQAKDADGNLLSSNVTAVASFTLQEADDLSDLDNPKYKGEIIGVSIDNPGSGYINDPVVTLSSAVHNELRVKNEKETVILSLNHQMDNIANGFNHDNFKTIINNSQRQRRGPNNFFSSPRIYNTGQTIAFLGDNQLSKIDSADINKYNTNTFVDIE